MKIINFKVIIKISKVTINEYCRCTINRCTARLKTSDIAVKFADYVLENYIDVDSKFPPTLWAQPPDVSGAIPHTNNGAEAYHSHLNAEFYVKIIHVC